MKKLLMKNISILLSGLMVLQVDNSFAMLPSDKDEASVSDNVCVQIDSDGVDWDHAIEMERMKSDRERKKRKDYVALDDDDAGNEQLAIDQVDEKAALVKKQEEEVREEHARNIHELEDKVGKLQRKVMRLERYEKEDSECLKPVDSFLGEKLCCHTDLAHIFNRRFCVGFACGGAISFVVIAGMVVKSFF